MPTNAYRIGAQPRPATVRCSFPTLMRFRQCPFPFFKKSFSNSFVSAPLSPNKNSIIIELFHGMRLLAALKKSIPAALLLGALGLATAPVARAQLVLNLDKLNHTLWFTGTSSGNTDGWGGSSWMSPFQAGQPAGGSVSITAELEYTSYLSSLTPSGAPAPRFLVVLKQDSSSTYYLSVQTYFAAYDNGQGTGGGPISIIGSDLPASHVDYAAALGLSGLDFLTPGMTLPNNNGSGFGLLSVNVVSAVPEPSTYAAFAGLGVLGVAGYRRRRRQEG